MDQLRAMRVFAKVVELGSFAATARALNLAPAVVTRLIADLEDQLGARLMNRSTRSLTLTEVGSDYLQRLQQILHDIDEADALASDASRRPFGTVRLRVPPAVSVHQLAKHLPRFFAQNPQVTIDLSAQGPVETPDEAFDISILWTRQPPDGDFIARRLARTETLVCAAPAYLAQRGRPQQPQDLARHDALLPPLADLQQGLRFRPGPWRADVPAAEVLTVMPGRALLRSTHVDTMYAAALAGLGIAGLPSYVAEDALRDGRLERVLPDWHLFAAQLWAALPSRKHVPARTRVLLDFLLEVFGGTDRDPWLTAINTATTPPAAAPAA